MIELENSDVAVEVELDALVCHVFPRGFRVRSARIARERATILNADTENNRLTSVHVAPALAQRVSGHCCGRCTRVASGHSGTRECRGRTAGSWLRLHDIPRGWSMGGTF